jgi:hypothetical protein
LVFCHFCLKGHHIVFHFVSTLNIKILLILNLNFRPILVFVVFVWMSLCCFSVCFCCLIAWNILLLSMHIHVCCVIFIYVFILCISYLHYVVPVFCVLLVILSSFYSCNSLLHLIISVLYLRFCVFSVFLIFPLCVHERVSFIITSIHYMPLIFFF